VQDLGAAYVSKLDAKFGRKGVSDFVTYWFPKSHDHLPEGGRAGFVATKSVKQGDGRKVSLDYVVDNDGVIIDAVSSMPWSGVANVHVSIVNWQKGGKPPALKTLWMNPETEPLLLETITSALSPNIDLREAVTLKANRGFAFQGQTNNVKAAFELGGYDARRFATLHPSETTALHPLLGGKKLLHATSSDEWIIDIPTPDADVAWREFPVIMKHLESRALPVLAERAGIEAVANALAFADDSQASVNTHKQGALGKWWSLWRRRAEYLEAVANLPRYIAVNRTAAGGRLPVFAFVDGRFRANDSIIAYPFEDDYSFGILQSAVHETWFRARGTTLGTAPRFGTSVYAAFPWPQSATVAQAERVAGAAAALVSHAGAAFGQGYSLGDQFDVLRKPGKSTLRSLKDDLDIAVIEAYQFDAEEPLLDQIFELNLLCAQRAKSNTPVVSPGPVHGLTPTSTWKWPAPRFN
jgi:hypothetical protein